MTRRPGPGRRHPPPNTVSGTRSKIYAGDYLQPDRLLGLLGRHRDVFLSSGHTHWDLTLSDWYVRRVVPGTANLDGFSEINTGAVQTGFADNGQGGEATVPVDHGAALHPDLTHRTAVLPSSYRSAPVDRCDGGASHGRGTSPATGSGVPGPAERGSQDPEASIRRWRGR